ncbi:MAG: hypothetical protein LIO94_02890 [Clostridiales bacterium]|nr:hypothetical protein [Clostridiales bacterium]
MNGYEKLFQILEEEYGISSMKQLDEALKKLGYLDITRFCAERKKGECKA